MPSRRRFLGAVAAVVTATMLWPSRALAGIRGLTGRIQRFDRRGALDLLTRAGSERVWFVGAGAAVSTFNRDGPAGLSDFIVGDEVVVELMPRTTAADLGKRMELLYRVTYGWIQEVTPTHVVTSGGRARLSPSTVIHEADNYYQQLTVADLVIGRSVAMTTRFDPPSDEPLARNIAVFAAY